VAPEPGERRRLQTRAGVLEYAVSGQGNVTIVLFNGAGETLESWHALYPRIEQLGTVFAWNRFGVQGSDAPQLAQSGAVVVASLRQLLGYAGLPPPYVLVAHSLGGAYADLFARLYPQEVAAVLFIEATHPQDQAALADHEARIARTLARLQSLPASDISANLHAEITSVSHLMQEVEAAGPFPPVPVAVVTGGADPPPWLLPPQALQARREHQRELAELSPGAQQVIAARSGHFPQRTEPDLVLAALRRLIAA
jgi:pimeloyl-ACP methyl ester carboxylesterase